MSDNDKLLDHEYDGIKELDNNLPLWWLWTFFLAIIFSFIYWIHYSLTGDGPTLDEELSAQMAIIETQRKSGGATDQALSSEVDPAILLALGAKTYKNNCASCHMENGAGSIGPNLTDSYWLHGSSKEDLKKVIDVGVLDKGMPPWNGILRPNEIDAVVVFIESLKNTNVEGGKAAQGEKSSE